MQEPLLYLYRVTHPEHGEIHVKAQDRLQAIREAERAWGTGWTDNERRYLCERLGPAPAESEEGETQ